MFAERRPLEDRQLWSAAVALPLMPMKVVAAIHWEAVKLWLKGVRLTRQPPPAWEPLTAQRQSQETRLGR